MKLKKVLVAFVLLAAPFAAVSCAIPLAITSAFIAIDANKDFESTNNFLEVFKKSSNLVPLPTVKGDSTAPLKPKPAVTTPTKNNQGFISVEEFNKFESTNLVLGSPEDTFRKIILPGGINKSSNYYSLNRNLDTRDNLMWNLYKLLISKGQRETEFTSLFQSVYGNYNYRFSWNVTKSSAEQFLKTYLGSYLILSFFSSYDVSNWYNLEVDEGVRFNQQRPTFLNKDVLDYIEANEGQKKLLSQLYGNLNNWYANFKSESVKSVTFRLSSLEQNERLLFSSNQKLNFTLSTSVLLNTNTLLTSQKPSANRSPSNANRIIEEKRRQIASRGDFLVGVLPASVFKSLSSQNNTAYTFEPLSKTINVQENGRFRDVSTIFQASEFNTYEGLKPYNTSLSSLRNSLIKNDELFKNYVRKYQALGNFYKPSDKIVTDAILASRFFEKNSRRVQYLGKNIYFEMSSGESLIYIVATNKNRSEFLNSKIGSNDVLRLIDTSVNNQNINTFRENLPFLKVSLLN